MKLFSKACELESKNLSFALLTIIDSDGIVPRKEGRMIVTLSGDCFGTVGGGEVEIKAKEKALKALENGKNEVITIAGKHGDVKIMVDIPQKNRRLVIIGYGHVGRAIADLLFNCGFSLTIINSEKVDENRAEKIIFGKNLASCISKVNIDSHTAVVVTVHDNDEIKKELENTNAFYIGYLSSRTRAVASKKNLALPMGLDIGAITPEEIAISVGAEILSFESGKSAKSISRQSAEQIIVRGTGDLATAVIIRLHNAGYNVLGVDLDKPTQIRRNVAFAEAMYEGKCEVDGITAVKIKDVKERFSVWDEDMIPIISDEKLLCLNEVKPTVVVDAIIAKKNLGTHINMAPLTIALGPGFYAGKDVDVVIETNRGHDLARIIKEGEASPNTGVPGIIEGYGKERVVRAPSSGLWKGLKTFGDEVKKGEIIAYVNDQKVEASISGIIRGMLHDGLEVTPGFKVADIDPRGLSVKWWKPSDKARALAGAVLEVVDNFLFLEHRRQNM